MKITFYGTKLLATVSGMIVLFLLPTTGSAQQPVAPGDPNAAQSTESSSSSQNSQEKKDAQAEQSSPRPDTSNPEPPHVPMAPASPLFRLGGGGLLHNDQSPLRLGPIYVSAIDTFGAYDRFTPSSSSTPEQSQSGAVFLSDIVFDASTKRSRVTAQWEPHLSVLDGVARGDAGNVTVAMQTTVQFSERFGLTLSNSFSDIASRLLYGNFFFTSGVVEMPAAQQNSFLDAPGHAINDVARAKFDYKLSQLTTFTFMPSFSYFHTNTDSALLNDSRQYSGEFSLRHIVTPRTTIGLGYSVSAVKFETTPDATLYHTGTGTYIHLFTPSLSFSGAAGLSTFVLPGAPRTWTFSGSATLLKSYRASYLSIAYNRGLYLADYTTNGYTNRVDGQLGVQVNSRINFRIGGGFQKESRDNGFEGRYTEAVANFRLAETLTLYGRYTYTYQSGDQTFLITGSRNLYVMGIRWDAGVRPKQ